MLFKIVWNNIFKNKLSSFLIVFSLVITIIFSFWFFFVYKNIEWAYVKKQIWEVNLKRFYIKDSAGGIFNIGNKKKLDESIATKLEKDPRIDKVYKYYLFDVPSTLDVGLLKLEFTTDVIVFAISDNFYNDHGYALGVGISDKILDFYNTNLAGTTALYPTINQNMLKILDMKLTFGKSTFYQYDSTYSIDKKITAIDPNLPVLWLTIPKSYADEITAKLKKWKAILYKIQGITKDEAYIPEIINEYKQTYEVGYDQEMYLKIQNKLKNVKFIMLLINSFAVIILVSFLIYIVYSITERNKKIYFTFKILWASTFLNTKIMFYEIYSYFIFASFISLGFNILISKEIAKFDISKYLYDYKLLFLNFQELWFIILIYFLLITIIGLIFSGKQKVF